jgi:hypothetical protein
MKKILFIIFFFVTILFLGEYSINKFENIDSQHILIIKPQSLKLSTLENNNIYTSEKTECLHFLRSFEKNLYRLSIFYNFIDLQSNICDKSIINIENFYIKIYLKNRILRI